MDEQLPGIISTKITIPPMRGEIAERTELLDALSASTASVVLVRAPAGYGKSTTLQQWAHHDPRRFAWVSLDPTEADPTLFWRYLYAAIRVGVPEIDRALEEELALPNPDLVRSVLPKLLNQLTRIDDPIVIVLDDYHRIQSSDVDQTLQILVRHLPRAVTVAIGTRTRTNLEIARLRSRGLVHDVKVSDLSFTLEETSSILHTLRDDLSGEDIAWIHDITEGWPAGVYLFGSVDRLDRGAGTTADVRDYLFSEMLSAVPEDDLRFMRMTATLSHLEARLCNYVTGSDDAHDRLGRLAGENLLIRPLDEAAEQYGYHHLLQAELLRGLEREEPVEVVASVHHRAMQWEADQGHITEAVHHANRAGDVDSAIGLVSEHWYDYIMSGRGQTAFQWLHDFSERDLASHPRLTVAAAMISAFTGHWAEARHLPEVAASAASEGPVLSGASTFDSAIAIMRASIVADGPNSALVDARRAADIEPIDGAWRPAIVAMLGTFLYSTGASITEAYPLLLEGAKAATGPPEIGAYALGNLALMHAWRDDEAEALEYARRAIDKIDETRVGGLMLYGLPYAVAARFVLARDGEIEGLRLLRSAEHAEQAATNSAPFDAMVLRTTIAEAHAAIGEFGAARVFAERALGNLAEMTDGGLVERRLDTVIRHVNRSDPKSRDRSVPSRALLSPRETQILSLLATAETLEEIGRRLYISRNTVKTHTASVYRKLGAGDRHQAVAIAKSLDLI